MRILHTSDWHLGRSLYGRKRYDEFEAFLAWLNDTIKRESIDTLLVAGDVFDTSTPGNRAQEIYYRFLCRAAASQCRHIVLIAGNHDSPSFLEAPRELLRALNVHVVGAAANNPENEVILLKDSDGVPGAIICAVPYLRDRDIRTVDPGENAEDKSAKLVEGMRRHYASVCAEAEKVRAACRQDGHPDISVIAMGHLFAAGGKTVDGDGVRELYVGSLAHVGTDVFPGSIDYLALGHLHVPQRVAGEDYIRYSGSPIPIGFGEAGQEKQVLIIDTGNSDVQNSGEFKHSAPSGHDAVLMQRTLEVRELKVPCFQPLVRISGTLERITGEIKSLKDEGSSAWLEIEYTGDDLVPDLRELLEDALDGSALEIRRIRNRRIAERIIGDIGREEDLGDLDTREVFERCLDHFQISRDDRPELVRSYGEIIESIQDQDMNAE